MTLLPQTRTQIVEAAARQAAPGGRWPWRTLRRPSFLVGRLVPVLSVVIAIVIAAVALSIHSAPRAGAPAGAGSGTRLVLQAESLTGSEPVTAARVRRDAAILRQRFALELPARTRVTVLSGHRVAVTSPSATVPELEAIVAATPRLVLYDWEANVLLPDGRPVASRLASQKPDVLAISQGTMRVPPGGAVDGSLDLYAAVRLAASQPARFGSGEKPIGDQYYLFGSSAADAGDAACAAGTGSEAHCLLAGPLLVATSTPRSRAVSELEAPLPAADRTGGQVLVVKPGTIVVEAQTARWPEGPVFGEPDARYFVLRDRVGVRGQEITSPRASQGTDGEPDIAFSFTQQGARAFERVTAAVAQRGQLLSTGPRSLLFQHFAIVFGDRIVTVPYIDFRLYPDGIAGNQGADVSGDFTPASARHLVAALGLGQLALPLVPVSGG